VAHGLLDIGGAKVMVEGVWPGIASRPPDPDGSSPVALFVYVPDVDAAVGRAVGAGAKVLMPVEDRFWGDRTGRIVDPAGHVWTVATRVEEASAADREARWAGIVKG
jgi:PhnB protein